MILAFSSDDKTGVAVAATGRASPRVVFLPTAARDSADYAGSAEAAFRLQGAGRVTSLFLSRNPPRKTVERELEDADLIFWGGGSAPLAVRQGDRHGLRDNLVRAQARGAVLAGVSGGAIALYRGGCGAYNGYRPLSGWGLVPDGLVPHFHPGEETALAPWFERHPESVLWGLEDGMVLVWEAGRPSGVAWKITGPNHPLVQLKVNSEGLK